MLGEKSYYHENDGHCDIQFERLNTEKGKEKKKTDTAAAHAAITSFSHDNGYLHYSVINADNIIL